MRALLIQYDLEVKDTKMRSFLDEVKDSTLLWRYEEEGDVLSLPDVNDFSSDEDDYDSEYEDDHDDDEVDDDESQESNHELLHNNNIHHFDENDAAHNHQHDRGDDNFNGNNNNEVHNQVPAEAIEAAEFSIVQQRIQTHPRANELIFRIARSEELPLVRAAIDWNLLISQLSSYPASELGDTFGSVLLQSITRMNPPCHVIQATMQAFPKSCVNMDAFYSACQHASDDVVHLITQKTIESRSQMGIQWGMLAFLGDARISLKHAHFLLQLNPTAIVDPEHGMFDVSPLDRMLSGAFIHGDNLEWCDKLKLALFTASKLTEHNHAHKNNTLQNESNCIAQENQKLILPPPLSPDDYNERLSKRIKTIQYTSNTTTTTQQKFYPYHELLRRIASPNFRGTQFGLSSFIRTLSACVVAELDRSERNTSNHNSNNIFSSNIKNSNQPSSSISSEFNDYYNFLIHSQYRSDNDENEDNINPFCEVDDNGDLPIHVLLGSPCKTKLRLRGDRKLIKFLLRINPESATIPNGQGVLPLRLCIENAWPVYDLLINLYPKQEQLNDSISATINDTPDRKQSNIISELPLHTVLEGKYHPRFGVSGARTLIKYLVKHFPDCAKRHNRQGRLALHLALENGWPVHDILLAAAPPALETRDLLTRLYPFQILACSEPQTPSSKHTDKNTYHLSCLFELIREAPMLLHGLVPPASSID